MPAASPYGSWPSPITVDQVVAASTRLGEVRVGERDVFWSELRPHDGGRTVVVRRSPGGEPQDVLPAGWSARTRVHEYGGAAWWLHDDVLFFANWDDQRLYRFVLDGDDPPVALTPAPAVAGGDRYADGEVTPDHRWVVCVREREGDDGPAHVRNEVVAVAVEPAGHGPPEPAVLVSGPDFVSSPRVSPDGRHLAWLQWDHPDMPWDATELWVATLAGAGTTDDGRPALLDARCVAGGADESLLQPEWAPDGTLHVISDRTGWWNLHRVADVGRSHGPLVPVAVAEGEIGLPHWVFGTTRYALLADGRVLCALARDGRDRLAVNDGTGRLVELDTPYTAVSQVRPFGRGAVVVAGTPYDEPAVVVLDLDDAPGGEPTVTEAPLSVPSSSPPDRDHVSVPEHLHVPTPDGEVTHANLYRPTNPSVEAPAGPPPLLVSIHGGPTSAARAQLDLRTQFWTSRGFAVVDVDYRGSSGYGRAYRRRLDGGWGVVDVQDCVTVARHLADAGEVDGERLAIHGGSAGGFTTLAALERHDAFDAGTAAYPVVDLEALARDTHKFELRYLDRLIGPYPEARDRYVERSPLHHAASIDVPVLLLQGLEDRVVPPSQTEALVEQLRSRGVAYAYLAFDGEQHGFRRADTIRRVVEAELGFYAAVFAFEPADEIEPLELHASEASP